MTTRKHVDSFGMFIGTNEASVAAARKVIVEIATLTAPPEVRVEGIKALVELCKVQNVTVRDCNVTMKARR